MSAFISSFIPWASPQAQFRVSLAVHRGRDRAGSDGGGYILGAEVETFERAFAELRGVSHGVGVGSGTDALILAVRALGIGLGDEVITVSHTAVATAERIRQAARRRFSSTSYWSTYTQPIQSAQIELAITPRTKAVVPVQHPLWPRLPTWGTIVLIARRHGLRIVEDCAQATGGRYRGKRLGSIGDIGCFSFYPTKNLGRDRRRRHGDYLNDAELAARVRLLAAIWLGRSAQDA